MATIKKAVVETKENGLAFHVTDGETISINVASLSHEIEHQAMLHGLKQKIADSYAGLKTSYEIEDAIKQVITTLVSGQWNSGRSSLGGIWVEALAKAAGVSLDEALAKWNDMDEDSKKDVKKNAMVKQAKAEIELERAKVKAKGSSLDLDSLV